MSFPRYPKYKPSGVEWLGDVPQHWDAARLSHCEPLGASRGFLSAERMPEPAASAVPLTEARP